MNSTAGARALIQARGDDAPEPVDIHVGLKLRAQRKQLGMSQSELAEACGISFQQIQKYERGANRISASRLAQLAGAVKASPGWFFEGLQLTNDGRLSPEARAWDEALIVLTGMAGGAAFARNLAKLDFRYLVLVMQMAAALAELPPKD